MRSWRMRYRETTHGKGAISDSGINLPLKSARYGVREEDKKAQSRYIV